MNVFGSDLRQEKGFRAGTHRTRTPAETLATYEPLMPACGITRIANVTGLDLIGIPVFVAIRPASLSVSVAQGKGVDRDSARASALMEAIEVWHAENVPLPIRTAPFARLAREAPVLDLGALPLRKGEPYDFEQELEWVEGWDLLTNCPRWVPHDLVHLDGTRKVPSQFAGNSNGLASGNHILEAIVHALAELIERDAVALYFADPSDPTGKRWQIDLATVKDPVCRAVIDRIAAAGLHLGAYDVTSDVGVPTFAALLFDRPHTPRAMGYFWGFGAHPAPEVALARAVTEAVQCRLTEITGAREDILPKDYKLNRDDDELSEMERMLLTPPASRNFAERASAATDSLEGDIEWMLDGLRRAGLGSATVVDLRQPALGVPVVKAIVPGLEPQPFSDEYLPGPRARRVMESVTP